MLMGEMAVVVRERNEILTNDLQLHLCGRKGMLTADLYMQLLCE